MLNMAGSSCIALGMKRITAFLVDAGIENIRVRCLGSDGRVWRELSSAHHGRLKSVLDAATAPSSGSGSGRRTLTPGIFLTGKLSGEASAALGGGTQLMSEAVLRRAACCLLNGGAPEGAGAESVAIIDFSASGYCVVTAGRNGRPSRRRWP